MTNETLVTEGILREKTLLESIVERPPTTFVYVCLCLSLFSLPTE